MSTRLTPIGLCERIAAAQHGVISRAQARNTGLSGSAIDRLVRAQRWARVHHAVYALWTPTDPTERWRHRLMAGALWLGEGSVVSHRAAAMLWELDGIDKAPLEFSTTGRRRPSDTQTVVHRVRSIGHIAKRGSIPVTSVPRTVLDLAAFLLPRTLELAFESALRRDLATLPQLAIALERSGATCAGRGALRSLVEQYPGRKSERLFEVIVERILVDAGLPRPVRQYVVWDQDGHFVARVDLAYPALLIAIEADGFVAHSSPIDFRRDRHRQNALVRLGWTVYRVTWDDATNHDARVARDVASLLARAEQQRFFWEHPYNRARP